MNVVLPRLHGLDLFSGIGSNTLALRPWVKTIVYCEQDHYARGVLLSRMGDGSIEPAPIWDDVTTLHGRMFDTPIDIIIAGFPCQDISCAGRGAGLEGKRSGLFFEIVRLAEEIKPSFLFLENVAAIRTKGLDRVIGELSRIGYDCRWGMLSAFDVGAPHKRERWFCLAHSSNARLSKSRPAGDKELREESGEGVDGRPQFGGSPVADTWSCGLSGQRKLVNALHTETAERGSPIKSWDGGGPDFWSVEPNVGRVAHGVPKRVDRLRCLGNAVVPNQAREAFQRLMFGG